MGHRSKSKPLQIHCTQSERKWSNHARRTLPQRSVDIETESIKKVWGGDRLNGRRYTSHIITVDGSIVEIMTRGERIVLLVNDSNEKIEMTLSDLHILQRSLRTADYDLNRQLRQL